MSDYCGSCALDRRRRVDEDACPFTTLYWDFLARHRDRLIHNPRVACDALPNRRDHANLSADPTGLHDHDKGVSAR